MMKSRNLTQRFALLALLILSSGGCYQDPIRAKLSGTWKIEHGGKLTRRVNQDEAFDDDPSERMVLSFSNRGTLQTRTRMGDAIREKNGSWSVANYDEGSDKMTILCELIGQQTEHEVQFIEKDLIRLVPPNMAGTTSKLTFRRQP